MLGTSHDGSLWQADPYSIVERKVLLPFSLSVSIVQFKMVMPFIPLSLVVPSTPTERERV